MNRALLWLGLLGGGLAWAAHLLVAYVIAEWSCAPGAGTGTWLGLRPAAWLLIGLTLLTATGAALAVLAARRTRRAEAPAPEERDLAARLGGIGVVTSALFLAIILFEALPIAWYLNRC